ncbi:MAG: class I SAM-dependent methyltransferase [Patescibacteria group bacterium]
MANEEQFKLKTLFVGTRGVQEYRASIEKFVKPGDKILEVGCEWGTTSELIFQKCRNIIATDVSLKCIERARQMRPEIRFETLDVFNIETAMGFGVDFNKMYIDVSGLSGYRSLLDVISLLNMYASVFRLGLIVVKSGALKEFGRRCIAWEGSS